MTGLLVCIVLLGVFISLGHGVYRYCSLTGEREYFQKKLDERNAQLRFFADRMGKIRTELASIRRMNQTLEHKMGRGDPVLESGLGGPVRDVSEQNIRMRTYLNHESEFLESMWSEMEELELETGHELDRTVLLARFLETRSGFLSALPTIRPVHGGYISSHFGRRRDPFSGAIKMHTGIDIAHSARVPVHVAADGVVALTSRSPTYGNVISVYHGYGISTLYAHLYSVNVTTGDRVSRGQPIGVLGSTGRSTHAHLHYEVRIEGRPVNPYYFLPDEPTE